MDTDNLNLTNPTADIVTQTTDVDDSVDQDELLDQQAISAVDAAKQQQFDLMQKTVNDAPEKQRGPIIQIAEEVLLSEIKQLFTHPSINLPLSPDRFAKLRQLLSQPNLAPDLQTVKQTYQKNTDAIELLERERIDLGLPEAIEMLQKLFDQRYAEKGTVEQVQQEQKLAEAMLTALDNMTEEDPEFASDVADFLRLNQKDYEDWSEYIIAVANGLYYIDLLSSLILTASDLKKIPSGKIDQQAVFNLAPEIVKSLALSRSSIMRQLRMPESATESVPAAETPPVELDIS